MRLLLAVLFLISLQPVLANTTTPVNYPVSACNHILETTPQKNGYYLSGSSQQILNAGYGYTTDSTDLKHLKRKAKWVKWLGIGSLASLLIPFVNILSLPAAIVSLVMGGHTKRQTNDEGVSKDVKTGRAFSIATIAAIVIAAIIALLIVILVEVFFRAFFNLR